MASDLLEIRATIQKPGTVRIDLQRAQQHARNGKSTKNKEKKYTTNVSNRQMTPSYTTPYARRKDVTEIMAEAKATVTVTRYMPILYADSRDAESYDIELFGAMRELVSQLGYDLTMRTEVNRTKNEAWIQVTARKKATNG